MALIAQLPPHDQQAPIADDLLSSADDVLIRLKQLAGGKKGVVLDATPHYDEAWFDLFETCLRSNVPMLMRKEEQNATELARIIVEANVTVLAAERTLWRQVLDQLNTLADAPARLSAIVCDRAAKPQRRFNLTLHAMSRARIADAQAAYKRAPAVRNPRLNRTYSQSR